MKSHFEYSKIKCTTSIGNRY